MVQGFLLDLIDFFEFFELPFVVGLFPPVQARLCYNDI